MSVTVTVQDFGWDRLKKAGKALDGSTVEVGLHDAEQAQVGVWMEVGTSTIPARPWMSIAGDQGQAKILDTAGKAVGAIMDGAPVKVGLTKLGLVVQQVEREVITDNKVGGPALAPATVRAKFGSTKKLVDTGSMIQAIRPVVTIGGNTVGTVSAS